MSTHINPNSANAHPKLTIVITGASSGIGEATAVLFGKHGYRVALAARRIDRLNMIANQIQTHGGEALAVQTDVTKLEDVHHLVQTCINHYERVDILFNNAGFGRMDWLENLDPVGDIAAQINTNLLGLIQTTRAFLPYMIKHRNGHIIIMSSVAGLVATPTYSIYAASKFGVRGFSEALRREVGIYDIHVSTIYPGAVLNEFSRKAHIQRKTGVTTPAWLRLSNEDVAAAVLKLIRKPRRSLVIPWQMKPVVWANVWFPGLLDKLMEKYFVSKELEQ